MALERHVEDQDSIYSPLLTSSGQSQCGPHDPLSSSPAGAQVTPSFKAAVKWSLIFSLTNMVILTPKLVMLGIFHCLFFDGGCIGYVCIVTQTSEGTA